MLPDKIPDGYAKYSETKVFNRESIPEKLLGWHNTKAGVWGELQVLNGTISFSLEQSPETSVDAHEGDSIIIEPTVYHKVSLSLDARMQISFYRKRASE